MVVLLTKNTNNNQHYYKIISSVILTLTTSDNQVIYMLKIRSKISSGYREKKQHANVAVVISL